MRRTAVGAGRLGDGEVHVVLAHAVVVGAVAPGYPGQVGLGVGAWVGISGSFRIGQVSAIAGAFTGRPQNARRGVEAGDQRRIERGQLAHPRGVGRRGHRGASGVMVLIGGAVGVVGIPASSSYTHSR